MLLTVVDMWVMAGFYAAMLAVWVWAELGARRARRARDDLRDALAAHVDEARRSGGRRR